MSKLILIHANMYPSNCSSFQLRAALREVEKNLKLLAGQGQQVGGRGQGASSAGVAETGGESCSEDTNKRFLKSMNSFQVCVVVCVCVCVCV